MGIDLRDVNKEFFLKVKQLDMVRLYNCMLLKLPVLNYVDASMYCTVRCQALLVHVGEEHSVTTAFIDNTLGNPLFLRRCVNGLQVDPTACTKCTMYQNYV